MKCVLDCHLGRMDRKEMLSVCGKMATKNILLELLMFFMVDWSPYGIGQNIIFSSCRLFFFFPRLISAVTHWMYFHTWWGLSANLRCRSETCCMRLAENTGCKKIAIWAPSHNFVGLYLRN